MPSLVRSVHYQLQVRSQPVYLRQYCLGYEEVCAWGLRFQIRGLGLRGRRVGIWRGLRGLWSVEGGAARR